MYEWEIFTIFLTYDIAIQYIFSENVDIFTHLYTFIAFKFYFTNFNVKMISYRSFKIYTNNLKENDSK